LSFKKYQFMLYKPGGAVWPLRRDFYQLTIGARAMDATIIPFPIPASVQTIAMPVADTSSQQRLATALADLRAALEDQRRVLGEWRYAMTELSMGVVGLGYSLEGYQQTLSGVQTKLGDLRSESARLEAWATAAE
jgi:hypothetical protein